MVKHSIEDAVQNSTSILRKKTTTAVALILTLTMTAMLAGFSVANAAAVNRTAYFYTTVNPNPTGVNQQVLIVTWSDLLPAPDTPAEIATGARAGWHDITITVTKPDGSTTTIGPLTSDAIGSVYAQFVPDRVGTYTFQASFPGEWRNYTSNQFYYVSTTSNKANLTVQQDRIPEYPGVSLPTGFWRRPIENENRQWAPIASNWLGVSFLYSRGAYDASGSFNPYSTGPNSAHIIWTKPLAFGGLVGDQFGDRGYYSGLTYESKWSPPIIMNGRIYYNTPSYPKYGFYCVDLLTGEEIWWKNSTGAPTPTQNAYGGGLAYPQLTVGQLYDYDSPNQHGIIPYLWSLTSTGYQMYDAFTGNWILTIANASTGQVMMSETGDLLVYTLNGARNWLSMWNSSRVKGMLLGETGTNAWQWRPPVGATLDWKTGLMWNVTVPDVSGSQTLTKVGDVILAASSAGPTTVTCVGYDKTNGNQLFAINITSNAAAQEQGLYTFFFGPPVDGVFCWFKQETREWYGFDDRTGQQLWGPTVPYENPWGMFSSTSSGNGAMSPNIAYGKLFTDAYDGKLRAIDIRSGNIVWEYYSGNSGLETPYGSYPVTSGMFAIADKKVYVATGEHSPNQPMWRGSRMHAVDAETGQSVWNVLGWYETPIIADGYLVAFNNYDSQLYTFGKGLSATTVAAPQTEIPLRAKVLLQGTVTDQSPGDTCLGIPAAGTPAISDASMSQWMEYLYMQKPKPNNATGVTVHLTATDPNNNFQDIGNVTSDVDGTYAIDWTPPVPGIYKVTATFEGSESYFASSGTTHFLVGETPAAAPVSQTPTPTAPPTTGLPSQTPPLTTTPSASPTIAPPPATQDLTTMYVAIAAVVVIIAVAAVAVILKKRK